MIARLSLAEVARQVALSLQDGWWVNLGIGLPTLVAAQLPDDRDVVLHCENGMLGMGPPAAPGEEDLDLIDAGKRCTTLVVGGCFMSHADSFALIRGGHLDATVLGAYEVSAAGDLANWSLGEQVPAVGGAMDLAVGARRVFVMTQHVKRDGTPKLVAATTLPLTAAGVVSTVFTDLGVFEPCGDHFSAVALVEGLSDEELAAATGAPIERAPGCRLISGETSTTT